MLLPKKKKRESVVKLPSVNCINVFVDIALVDRCLNRDGVFLLTPGKCFRVLLSKFPAFRIQIKLSSIAGSVTRFFHAAINLAGSRIQFYAVAVLLVAARRFFSCATSGGRFPIYRFHKSYRGGMEK